MKLSSPRLNNVTVFGCVIVYVSVILLGVDDATLISREHFSKVCMVSMNNYSYEKGKMIAWRESVQKG